MTDQELNEYEAQGDLTIIARAKAKTQEEADDLFQTLFDAADRQVNAYADAIIENEEIDERLTWSTLEIVPRPPFVDFASEIDVPEYEQVRISRALYDQLKGFVERLAFKHSPTVADEELAEWHVGDQHAARAICRAQDWPIDEDEIWSEFTPEERAEHEREIEETAHAWGD